jgi:MFS family permease
MGTLFLGAMVPNLFVLTSRFLGGRGFDEQEIGIVMSAQNLTALAITPAIGWLVARLGHARALALGCAVTAAGAAVFLVADEVVGYAIGRALQGLGFSAVLVGGAAYVVEIAPPARLGEALGVSGVLTLAAQAVGPAIGEAILALGWDALFGAGVVFGFAGAAVALRLPAARHHHEAGAIVPASPAAAILVAIGLAGMGFGAIWMFLADYVHDVGIARTTWFFVPYVIAAIATRLFLGDLSDRIGRRQAAAPALAGHALILFGMAVVSAPWQLVGIGLIYGLCHGVYYPTLQAMIVERSGGRRSRAVAAATFAFGAGVIVAGVALGAVARAWGYPAIYPIASAAGVVATALIATSKSLREA